MQFAPLVLKGVGGVVLTFQPRDITNGVATYVRSTGIPIADQKVTISQSRTPTGRIKTVMKISIPEVQDVVVNGVSRPTVVRVGYAEMNFTAESTSSSLERENMSALIYSLFTGDLITKTVINLETLY